VSEAGFHDSGMEDGGGGWVEAERTMTMGLNENNWVAIMYRDLI